MFNSDTSDCAFAPSSGLRTEPPANAQSGNFERRNLTSENVIDLFVRERLDTNRSRHVFRHGMTLQVYIGEFLQVELNDFNGVILINPPAAQSKRFLWHLNR